MACNSGSDGGYDLEFLDAPPKLKEFECAVCLLVTREPSLTSCCGQHFCQSCINKTISGGRPCPLCKEKSFSVLLDKKQTRKVLELYVHCSLKERGCGWTGVLGELDSHIHPQTGSCQFVEVTCPNTCGESLERRYLDAHLSDACPQRPFACKYCAFKATYEQVCKHNSECEKVPINCPNECSVGVVERGKMKEHLSECPLQLVECDLAHVGCSDKVRREDLNRHMEQNLQQHLLWTITASQRQVREMEDRVRRQDEDQRVKDRRMDDFERELEELKVTLKEKDKEIDVLSCRVKVLEAMSLALPPVEFPQHHYSNHKGSGRRIEGPVLYTHMTGAKIQICLFFSTNKTVDVEMHQLPGEFDDMVDWPVNCTLTVHLLNQLSDQDHISGSWTYLLERPTRKIHKVLDPLQVDHRTIRDHSKKAIQYLKDDCLHFRVDVELSSPRS